MITLSQQMRPKSFTTERGVFTALLTKVRERWQSGDDMAVGKNFLREADKKLVIKSCDKSKKKRCYQTDKHANDIVNDIRMKVLFTGSPSENVVAAFDDLLGAVSSKERRILYHDDFVSQRLVAALDPDDGSAWVKAVVAKVENSEWAVAHGKDACEKPPSSFFSSFAAAGDAPVVVTCLQDGDAKNMVELVLEKALLRQRSAFARELTARLRERPGDAATHWLLDWVVVRAVMTDAKGEIGHEALKRYSGATLHLLPRLLEVSVKDARRREHVLKYAPPGCATAFDLAVRLGEVPTQDPTPVHPDGVAQCIRSVLEAQPKLRDTFEVEFVKELVTLVSQDATAGSSDLKGLLKVLDHVLVSQKFPLNGLIEAVDNLRMKVEFAGLTGGQAVVQAVNEMLNVSTSDDRRTLYYAFLPKLVEQASDEGSTTYAQGVVAAARDGTWVKGVKEQQRSESHKMVKLLLEILGPLSDFGAELTKALEGMVSAKRRVWLVDELTVAAVRDVAPNQVGHAALKAYCAPNLRLVSRWVSEEGLPWRYASGNFDLVVELGGVKTREAPSVSATTLAYALVDGIRTKRGAGRKLSKEAKELDWLRGWIQQVQTRYAMPADTPAVTKLIASLDEFVLVPGPASSKLYPDVVHDLRYHVELSGTPVENLRAALGHLQGDVTAADIYLSLLKGGFKKHPAVLPAARSAGSWAEALTERLGPAKAAELVLNKPLRQALNIALDLLTVDEDGPAIATILLWVTGAVKLAEKEAVKSSQQVHFDIFVDMVKRMFVPYDDLNEVFKREPRRRIDVVDVLRQKPLVGLGAFRANVTTPPFWPPTKRILGAAEAAAMKGTHDSFRLTSSLLRASLRDKAPMEPAQLIQALTDGWRASFEAGGPEGDICAQIDPALELLYEHSKLSELTEKIKTDLEELVGLVSDKCGCETVHDERKKPRLSCPSEKLAWALQRLGGLIDTFGSWSMGAMLAAGVAGAAALGGVGYCVLQSTGAV